MLTKILLKANYVDLCEEEEEERDDFVKSFSRTTV
jgi:hypothetical protein